MVEAVKTQAALLAEMADGGNNTAEEVRNGIVSMWTPGWVRYLQHRLPDETPNASDDFFDDGSFSGWTALTVTGDQTITEARDKCSVAITSSIAASDANAALKTVAPSFGDVIETRLGVLNNDVGTGAVALGGLCWADGEVAASNAAMLEAHMDGSFGRWVVTGRAGSFTAIGTGTFTVGVGSPTDALYLRLEYDAADSFIPYISVDGISWHALTTISDAVTPVRAGIVWSNLGTTLTGQTASFDYFRYNAA